MTEPLRLSDIGDAVLGARSVLVGVDLDATLCSTTSGSACALLPARAIGALARLTALPKVVVAALAEGVASEVQSTLPNGVVVAGNDGLEIEGRGLRFVHPEAARLTAKLVDLCNEVTDVVSAWPNVWVENKRLTATVHLRTCPTDHWRAIRDAVRTVVRPVDDEFTLRSGRAAFDIAPRIGWDKGSALKYIERSLDMEDAVTICVGDSDGDACMMGGSPHAIPVRLSCDGVDVFRSAADLDAVAEVLEFIADVMETAPRRPTLASLSRQLTGAPI